MRVDVRKFLFAGILKEKRDFFERAQELGVIEFIDTSGTTMHESPPEIQRMAHAIKVLRGLPTVEQEETYDYSRSTGIVDKILDLQHAHESSLEEKRVISQEMARIHIFGDFSLGDLAYIQEQGHRQLQFFCARRGKFEETGDFSELIYVDSDHGLDYFVAITPELRSYEGLIEIKIEKPYSQLKRRFDELNLEIHECEAKLKEYAKYHDYLHRSLKWLLNRYNLEAAEDFIRKGLEDQLFFVEGWVADDKHTELAELLRTFHVQCEEIAVEESDRAPTSLTNKGLARVGEDLVHIYDTPGINDKDPSPWVLGAFALFFAVILGDGGYGFLLLLLALYLHYKFRKAKGLGKRLIQLLTVLSISCITWGFLTTNFFGIKFDLNSPLRKVSAVQWLVEQKADYHIAEQDDTFTKWSEDFPGLYRVGNARDFFEQAVVTKPDGRREYQALDKFSDNVMLELALMMGVIHIILSFLRTITSNWSGIGWIAFMVGAYLYFPSVVNATSMIHYAFGVDPKAGAEAGLDLIYGGIGLSLILAIVKNGGFGVLEIANLIQVFADVLSYLRLYALGLAGSMMSGTFNDIGMQMPIVVGILVILVGHIVNIVLSVMGGVIHGLRLNFLEWYHYCFEGGGRMHQPLALLEVE